MNWFYESGGQQQGPVSDSDLNQLLAEGKVNASTLVWREGMASWQPLSEARPNLGAPGAPGGLMPVAGAAGTQCASCGRVFPPSEVVQIGGRWICPSCKPAVLQSVQQGASLSMAFDSARTGPAWEQRATLGVPKAAFETAKAVLMNPTETFERMKREGGIGGPLAYAALIGWLGGALGIIYQLLGNQLTTAALQRGMGVNQAQPPLFPLVGIMIGYCIFMPAIIALSVFIGGGILHLSLMLCGGAKQPFETTFRVYCYVHGSTLLLQIIPFGLIPMFGVLLVAVWSLVVVCIGVSKAQEITVGKAVLAVLLPVIVCCVLAFFIAMGVAVMATAASRH